MRRVVAPHPREPASALAAWPSPATGRPAARACTAWAAPRFAAAWTSCTGLAAAWSAGAGSLARGATGPPAATIRAATGLAAAWPARP
ncbi:MAG: hypothetical protein JJU40_03230, partial [Rhodobacteraceae bacterium]|nr:hypothetical protein [Paracoccaceae bacterium]